MIIFEDKTLDLLRSPRRSRGHISLPKSDIRCVRFPMKSPFVLRLLLLFGAVLDLSAYTDPSVVNSQLVKRFEYKLSFRGPHVSFKDGSVPFWTTGGSEFAERFRSIRFDSIRLGAIASDDQVRVTPSIRSQRGRVWSKTPLTADNWLLELKVRITGRGRVGADGMVRRRTRSFGRFVEFRLFRRSGSRNKPVSKARFSVRTISGKAWECFSTPSTTTFW